MTDGKTLEESIEAVAGGEVIHQILNGDPSAREGRSVPGVTGLYAVCHPEHAPSRRVLEKCGFIRDVPATRRTEFPNLSPGIEQDADCYVLALEAAKGGAG